MAWKEALRRRLRIGTRNETARAEWVKRQLEALPAGWRLLDAGCGEQQYRKHCGHLAYTGQDFGQYDGQGDGGGLQTESWDQSRVDILSDITAIPVAEKSFDALLCTEVFEHIPDPPAALLEFARIIRPGGSLILTAPFSSLSHFTPYYFGTGFSLYWYRFHLEKAGFELVSIEANGSFFEFLAQELWRLPQATKSYCAGEVSRLVAWLALALFGLPLLITLQWLGRRDGGSNSLACHGYHVLAKRVRLPRPE